MKRILLPTIVVACEVLTSHACLLDPLGSGPDSVTLDVMPGGALTVWSGYASGPDIPGRTRQLGLIGLLPPTGGLGRADLNVSSGALHFESWGDCEVSACVRYDSSGGGFIWMTGSMSEFAALAGVWSTDGFLWTVSVTTRDGSSFAESVPVPPGAIAQLTMHPPWDGNPFDIFRLEVCLEFPPNSQATILQIGIPEPAAGWACAGSCLLGWAAHRRFRRWSAGLRLV